jgi:hypothetical protein
LLITSIARLVFGVPIGSKKYGVKHNNKLRGIMRITGRGIRSLEDLRILDLERHSQSSEGSFTTLSGPIRL